MKKGLIILGFPVLLAQLPLRGYDTSPNPNQIVPEAIWAQATGGGTWVTEVQITNFGATAAIVRLYFDTSEGTGFAIYLPSIPPLNTVKYSNILATMDALDSSAKVYYGKSGAIWFYSGNSSIPIQVQAQTVNGNYGKTFPGLNIVDGTTAIQGRPMMIQGLIRNAKYRTSVGVYNTSTTLTYTVRFTIHNATNGTIGSSFEKTLTPCLHLAFNPFVQAGAPAGDYDNCWLYMEVTSAAYNNGLMFYGSIANNYTNDTYALIARMWN